MLAACDRGVPERQPATDAAPEPQTIDTPQTVTAMAPVTTPMADQVAVLGLLNRPPCLSRQLTLKPRPAVPVADVLVWPTACDTTPPPAIQPLTGASPQVDVRTHTVRVARMYS